MNFKKRISAKRFCQSKQFLVQKPEALVNRIWYVEHEYTEETTQIEEKAASVDDFNLWTAHFTIHHSNF